jgi:hypothetical protein
VITATVQYSFNFKLDVQSSLGSATDVSTSVRGLSQPQGFQTALLESEMVT